MKEETRASIGDESAGVLPTGNPIMKKSVAGTIENIGCSSEMEVS
jgi:hypothetical protein